MPFIDSLKFPSFGIFGNKSNSSKSKGDTLVLEKGLPSTPNLSDRAAKKHKRAHLQYSIGKNLFRAGILTMGAGVVVTAAGAAIGSACCGYGAAVGWIPGAVILGLGVGMTAVGFGLGVFGETKNGNRAGVLRFLLDATGLCILFPERKTDRSCEVQSSKFDPEVGNDVIVEEDDNLDEEVKLDDQGCPLHLLTYFVPQTQTTKTFFAEVQGAELTTDPKIMDQALNDVHRLTTLKLNGVVYEHNTVFKERTEVLSQALAYLIHDDEDRQAVLTSLSKVLFSLFDEDETRKEDLEKLSGLLAKLPKIDEKDLANLPQSLGAQIDQEKVSLGTFDKLAEILGSLLNKKKIEDADVRDLHKVQDLICNTGEIIKKDFDNLSDVLDGLMKYDEVKKKAWLALTQGAVGTQMERATIGYCHGLVTGHADEATDPSTDDMEFKYDENEKAWFFVRSHSYYKSTVDGLTAEKTLVGSIRITTRVNLSDDDAEVEHHAVHLFGEDPVQLAWFTSYSKDQEL